MRAGQKLLGMLVVTAAIAAVSTGADANPDTTTDGQKCPIGTKFYAKIDDGALACEKTDGTDHLATLVVPKKFTPVVRPVMPAPTPLAPAEVAAAPPAENSPGVLFLAGCSSPEKRKNMSDQLVALCPASTLAAGLQTSLPTPQHQPAEGMTR